MKVRLIDHLATDHFGNIEPGCVLDIQPEMAARLVAARAAVLVDAVSDVVAVEESATVTVTRARGRARAQQKEGDTIDGQGETGSATGGERSEDCHSGADGTAPDGQS